MSSKRLFSALCMAATGLFAAQASHAITINGWTTTGSSGVSGADGVVSLSPFAGSAQYGWVSTDGGEDGATLSLGGTNGSFIDSPLFEAAAGDELAFYFNYVTSDGAGYSDYAWARLMQADGDQAALLFTARTNPGGNTVPGFGMETLNATLTL